MDEWCIIYFLKKTMPQNKWSLSTILILLSLAATIAATYQPNLYQFGMNRDFLDQWIYHIWVIQFFASQFLHAGFFHFLWNAIFILYFGNTIERAIWEKKYIIFFIGNSVFLGLFLSYLHTSNTYWISWFVLALLTYYALALWKVWNQEYKWAVTAILINIFIGFMPGVSFWGHVWGMLVWGIYFLLLQSFHMKKQK